MSIEASVEPKRRRSRRTAGIIPGVAAVVALGICGAGVIAAMLSSKDTGSSTPDPVVLEYQAEQACEGYVKDQLKAPASAEFGTAQAAVLKSTGRSFTITNTVDSDNSFGAKLRMNYVCGVTANADGSWHLDSLNLVNQ